MHPTTRGVALYGDKVFLAGERGRAGGARRPHRQGSVDRERRREPARLLHDAGAAGRRRPGDDRRLGRRVRHSRLRRRLRRRDRQAGVEDLHGAGARRAGQRDVAEGRPVEDRRRAGVGDRQLRSRDRTRLLGHRQRRTVDGRPAPRRQPLHRVDGRARREDRPDQRPLPVPPERLVGLGRGVAADPRRLPAQRPHREGADQRRAQRLSVVPRAQRRPDRLRGGQAVRAADGVPRASIRRPAGPTSIRIASRPPARRPRTSVRRTGAARTGRRSPSARRRG